jgi:hypothetical protein
MHAQRITVETIDLPIANECFRVMSLYGIPDLPRFTNVGDASYIISHVVPLSVENRERDNILKFVADNIQRIVYFTSEPA